MPHGAPGPVSNPAQATDLLPGYYRIGYGGSMTEHTAPRGAPSDPLVPLNVKVPASVKQLVTDRAKRDHMSQRAALIALVRTGAAADHEAQRRVYCAPGAHYAPASDVSIVDAGERGRAGVCAPCGQLLTELGLSVAEYLATRPTRED